MEIEIATQIRKPHPVITRLATNPTLIPVPVDHRRRAMLIAHTIVRESLQRGWAVAPPPSGRTPDRHDGWMVNHLFSVDAGERPVGIRLRMRLQQVPHVLTESEKRQNERWGAPYSRKHDHVQTDTLRLEVRPNSYTSRNFEDGKRASIEEKLDRALAVIQQATDDQIKRREEWQVRAEEDRRQRQITEARHGMYDHYGRWVSALGDLQGRLAKWETTTAFMGRLKDRLDRGDAEADERGRRFLEWTQTHLAASDPLSTFQFPDEPPPDIDFGTWASGR